MNALVLLAVVENSAPVETIAKTFGVDWPHLIAQIVSFSIVCALLYRFAYRPILAMLEQRREQIAQGLANTEKIKAELARTEELRHEVMLRANTQAAGMIEEARNAAALLLDKETQKAIDTAQQIVAKSRDAAAQDYARMLAELKQHLGDLVVQTTAMVIHKALSEDDQRRLAEDAARQLASLQGERSAVSGRQ